MKRSAIAAALVAIVALSACGDDGEGPARSLQAPSSGRAQSAATVDSNGADPSVTLPSAWDDRQGQSNYASQYQDLRAATVSASNVLVVVGVIGAPGESIEVEAPGASEATYRYTPVSVAVEETLRNAESRSVPDGLLLRSWPGVVYNGQRLEDFAPGTRVVAFIQTQATEVVDGADTATAVFEVDSVEGVHDPASGATISLAQLRSHMSVPS